MRGGEAWCTPGWSGKGEISWRFFFSSFFFFVFSLGDGRGKPVEVQGCGAVVEGRSGASLLLSFLLLFQLQH